jgi:glycosyltransferase involved in cell wall biosynthesis
VNVAILHYAAPPGIGGVEQTIYYHALELARLGHGVRILAGAGQRFDPRVEVVVIPELGSGHPEVLAVKRQLDRGEVTADFVALRGRLVALLAEALAGMDALIAHNVFTLHKNLPLTAALHEWLPVSGRRILGWHHDLAWDSPRYRQDLRSGYPWDLLRTPWPGVQNVTVSAAQQARLAALYGVPAGSIAVVPPGVDGGHFFRWTETTRRLVQDLGLLEADRLLLLPARLTRRKNVELALRILAELRQMSGQDARLIVTGPPGPHNPANVAYLERLLALRRELGLEAAAHFLYQRGLTPDDATMADLYQLADALLFPSTQEGFGIPLLEAGLVRLPIFCSDIASFREIGRQQVQRFSLEVPPAEVAALIQRRLDGDAASVLRRRVLAEYLWETIVRRKVIPLLEAR